VVGDFCGSIGRELDLLAPALWSKLAANQGFFPRKKRISRGLVWLLTGVRVGGLSKPRWEFGAV
jgi:hypothetical protein